MFIELILNVAFVVVQEETTTGFAIPQALYRNLCLNEKRNISLFGFNCYFVVGLGLSADWFTRSEEISL